MDESMAVPRIQPTSAIAKHIRRLRRSSRVRAIAERLAAGEDLSDAEISVLVLAVTGKSDRKWRERTVAAWCLRECELSPGQYDDATAALRLLLVDRSYSDGWGRVLLATWRSGVLSMVINACLFAYYRDYSGVPSNSDIDVPIAPFVVAGIALLSVLLFLPMLTVITALEETNLRKSMLEAVRALGKLADPLAVGDLATLQRYGYKALATAASESLVPALDAVRPQHYGRLPADATQALCDVLELASHDRARRILLALGCAGTGRGAGPLRSLLSNPLQRANWEYVVMRDGATTANQEEGKRRAQSVLDVAEAVLPILEERLRNETASERLLRPVEQPNDAEQVLLRPAGYTTSVPDEQLLRPISLPPNESKWSD